MARSFQQEWSRLGQMSRSPLRCTLAGIIFHSSSSRITSQSRIIADQAIQIEGLPKDIKQLANGCGVPACLSMSRRPSRHSRPLTREGKTAAGVIHRHAHRRPWGVNLAEHTRFEGRAYPQVNVAALTKNS